MSTGERKTTTNEQLQDDLPSRTELAHENETLKEMIAELQQELDAARSQIEHLQKIASDAGTTREAAAAAAAEAKVAEAEAKKLEARLGKIRYAIEHGTRDFVAALAFVRKVSKAKGPDDNDVFSNEEDREKFIQSFISMYIKSSGFRDDVKHPDGTIVLGTIRQKIEDTENFLDPW